MGFYCGIDLHAKQSQICVIDREGRKVLERKRVPSQLEVILPLLEPFREELKVVVESTFNWYWLVDGLQDAGHDVTLAHTLGMYAITHAKVKTDRRDAGHDVTLAHTLGMYAITHAKVKTDRRDAFRLARLLRAGEIHAAYIHPRTSRPIRDLIRERARVVSLRSGEYAATRMRLYQHGFLDHTRNSARSLDEEELAAMLEHPAARVLVEQQRQRIALYNAQVAELDRKIAEYANPCAAYQRLLGVPGLGASLAPIVFFETGEISRFASHKHYSSYCRLVAGTCESADKRHRARGSKQGNPHLKAAFTQAAQAAQRHYPRIRRFYEGQVASHPGQGAKLIATDIVAHKLAIAVYNILTKGVDYQERLIFGN